MRIKHHDLVKFWKWLFSSGSLQCWY